MNNDNGSINYRITLDNSDLRRRAIESKAVFQGISTSAAEEGVKIEECFGSIGKKIAGVFTIAAVTQFAKQIVQVRQEIESLEISFRSLLGNEAKADKLFSEIREFAVKTPMQLKDLASAAQMMLSFNIEDDKIMPYLKALGDISMGDAQKFQSLSLAFSQMSSTGKLMGQDLLQMINAGFNPLVQMAEKSGKSVAKLKEEMSAGKITAEMVQQAFLDAASAGGKFNGMLEAQSKSIQGAMSNLQGAIDDMMNNIGTATQGAITGALGAATELVRNYERVGRILLSLVAAYGMYRAAVMAATAAKGWATAAEAAHYHALLLVEKAQKALNKTMLNNPYVLAAAALASLIVAIASLKTEEERLQEAEEKYNQRKQEIIEKEEKHKQKIDELCRIAGDEAVATDTRRAALLNLMAEYPEVFKKYETEYEALKHIRDIKNEIAGIDNKESITNPENELKEVEERIAELTRISEQTISYKSLEEDQRTGEFKFVTKTRRVGLDRKRSAELKALQKRRAELNKQINKQSIDSYFEDLTGVSNEDLEKQLKVRQDLLDKIALEKIEDDDPNKAYYGKLTQQGDLNGRFSETELQDQANKLRMEINKRSAERKSGSEWVKEVTDNYLKAQKEYNDWLAKKDQMTQEEFDKGLEQRKAEFDAAEKEYNKVKPKKDQYGDRKQAEANQLAVQQAERERKIQQQAKALAKAERDAELEIAQSKIDAMDEGLAKVLAQNELNARYMEAANADRRDANLETLRDMAQTQWEYDNPKAKKDGKVFDRSTIKDEWLDLRAEFNARPLIDSGVITQEMADAIAKMRAQLQEFNNIAVASRAEADKKAIESSLSDIMTYQQQREKIEKDFADRRESLYKHDEKGNRTGLIDGVTEDNLAELQRQADEAMKAVDEQFASRSEYYQAWCNEIADYSLKQLESLLLQAQEELDRMKEDGDVDEQTLATQRAKVNTLTKKVNTARANANVNPGKRTLEEWKDLYEVLQDCEAQFEKIGDAVGGVAGNIIKTAGQIASSSISMINSIVQLANFSTLAAQKSAEGTSKAIQSLEKASLILTIISAAVQIATTIAGLFNKDNKKQKEIDALQTRIDQLQWELDNADTIRMQSQLSTKSFVEEVRKSVAGTSYQITRLAGGYRLVSQRAVKASEDTALLTRASSKLADAYANISYTAGHALGGAKYSNAREELENIAKQQILINEQIDLEKSKKKSDDSAISDMEDKIAELGKKAVELINELTEDIIGGSAQDIAKQLGDAFIEAFAAGEDAAKAWGDKVDDIVADILKNMLVQKYLEEPLGEIFDKYKSKWFKNGQFSGLQSVIDSMSGFADDLNAVGDDFKVIWESLPSNIKDMFQATGAAREATAKGIATASQESVDELNGRATAIQGHTYSISENTKQLLSTVYLILRSVTNIDGNTASMNNRMSAVETNVKEIKNTLNDFAIKGIKIQ